MTQARDSSTARRVEELGAIFEEDVASLATNRLFGNEVSIPMQNSTLHDEVDILEYQCEEKLERESNRPGFMAYLYPLAQLVSPEAIARLRGIVGSACRAGRMPSDSLAWMPTVPSLNYR